MARNFNTREIPKSQLVSTWLHEIPSDLESEGEETLVTPSVYEQTYPRRQKDETQHSQRQPQRRPKLEPETESEPEPLTPVRAPVRVPKFTPKQPLYPALKSLARSPTRPQPQPRQNQNPNQNQNHQNQPPPQPSLSPAKSTPVKPSPIKATPANPPTPAATTTPTPTPLALRDQILTNFHTNCTLCHPPLLPSTPSTPSTNKNTCPRCTQARAYTTRPHHNLSFLTSHLLPISEVLSFDETVAYLNQAVIARLAGVLARGGRGDRVRGVGRTWPTLDDFDFVRGVAEVRRGVLGGERGEGGGNGVGLSLGLDRFGMVRDRVGER